MKRARQARGFTLLELLVTLGILGVLFGLGVGMLRTSADQDELAMTVVRERLRSAALSARRTGLPTAVVLEQTGDVADPGQRLRVRTLFPIGHWHFEPTPFPSYLPQPTIGGRSAPGRFGRGREQDPEVNPEGLLVAELPDTPLYKLNEGFALRFDIYLESYAAVPLATIGRGLVVELLFDEFGKPLVGARIVRQAADSGSSGSLPGVQLAAPDLKRWTTIEVRQDGTRFALRVGDQERSKPSTAQLYAEGGQDVRIGADNQIFPGVVDEVRLLAYGLDAGEELPQGIALRGFPAELTFDGRGRLTESVAFELVIADVPETHRISESGTLD